MSLQLTKKNIKNWVLPTLIIVSALVIVYPMNFFLLVLIQSLAVHFLVLYLIIGVISALYKSWSTVSASLIAFLMLLFFLWPHLYLKESQKQASPPDLKVAQFNVLLYNKDYQSTIEAALACNADIISFQELSPQSYNVIYQSLSKKYPYQINAVGERFRFGIATFSKYPISNASTTDFKTRPLIDFDVLLWDKTVHMITVHTPSPVSQMAFDDRNRILNSISTRLEALPPNTLIIGDLNVVPWDNNIKKITQSSRFKDSRNTFGATFPAWLPIGKIPIDYIIHSKDMHCEGFSTLQGTSSDHLGIISSFSFKPNLRNQLPVGPTKSPQNSDLSRFNTDRENHQSSSLNHF